MKMLKSLKNLPVWSRCPAAAVVLTHSSPGELALEELA